MCIPRRSLDSKFFFGGENLAILAFDIRHPSQARAFGKRMDELFEDRLRALRFYFHRAIASVSRVAGNAKALGLLQAEIPKAHTLHAARKDEMDALHADGKTVWHPTLVGRILEHSARIAERERKTFPGALQKNRGVNYVGGNSRENNT